MGHRHDDEHLTLKHREALQMRQRVATFLLALSVTLVAAVVMLSAMRQRDAVCQDRAHIAVASVAVSAEAATTSGDVVSVLNEALAAQNMTLDASEVVVQHKYKAIDALDTGDGVLAKNGFTLLRRSDGPLVRWEMRTLLDGLCGQYPAVDMRVLENVDYERASYAIKAIASSHTTAAAAVAQAGAAGDGGGRGGGRSVRAFLMESSLSTQQKHRIVTFAQLQSLFPGFHALATSLPVLRVMRSWRYVVVLKGQLYYHGKPLDVALRVEQWLASATSPATWRVRLMTQSIAADEALLWLHTSVRSVFSARGWLCTSRECHESFELYLE